MCDRGFQYLPNAVFPCIKITSEGERCEKIMTITRPSVLVYTPSYKKLFANGFENAPAEHSQMYHLNERIIVILRLVRLLMYQLILQV